jgi:hypothetical protein
MLLFFVKTAWAADDTACIQSYEQTQTLRKQSRFREAHDEATKCARSECPVVLSKDCTKWLGELEQSIPTIVFDVKSTGGEELTLVKVTMDGKALVEKLDGKAVTMDVGPHTFRFESTDPKVGGQPVEQKIVIHEGDKNRKVSVTLGGAAKPPGGGGAQVTTNDGGDRPIPISTFVFGGAAVLGLGIGTVFAISGSSKEGDLDACRPNCPRDDVNSVSTSYAIADVLLSAGFVSAIAAVYIFLSRPTVPKNSGFNSKGLTIAF